MVAKTRKNKQAGDFETIKLNSCTNHMTYYQEPFKEINKTTISKVKITVVIKNHSSLKIIFNVLYVPGINQNLLSIAQLLEKGQKKKMMMQIKNRGLTSIKLQCYLYRFNS
ncbi:hypothetical protein CR513_15577, partial [Mucuna pruriens]